MVLSALIHLTSRHVKKYPRQQLRASKSEYNYVNKLVYESVWHVDAHLNGELFLRDRADVL